MRPSCGRASWPETLWYDSPPMESGSAPGRGRFANGVLREGIFEHDVALPFAVEEVAGAEHMLVGFPAMVLDGTGAPPLVRSRRRLKDLNAHRLFIGSDPDFLIGPRNEWRGGHAAAELIALEAERLGVPLSRTIAYGSSFRGTCALYVGLRAQVSSIVVGGAPVRIGHWIAYLTLGRAPGSQAAVIRHRLADKTLVHDAEQRSRLDRFIADAARSARHDAEIRLWGSDEDRYSEDGRMLVAELAGHPTVRCRFDLGDYGGHDQLGGAFFRYLHEVLRPIVGRTQGATRTSRQPAPARG